MIRLEIGHRRWINLSKVFVGAIWEALLVFIEMSWIAGRRAWYSQSHWRDEVRVQLLDSKSACINFRSSHGPWMLVGLFCHRKQSFAAWIRIAKKDKASHKLERSWPNRHWNLFLRTTYRRSRKPELQRLFLSGFCWSTHWKHHYHLESPRTHSLGILAKLLHKLNFPSFLLPLLLPHCFSERILWTTFDSYRTKQRLSGHLHHRSLFRS